MHVVTSWKKKVLESFMFKAERSTQNRAGNLRAGNRDRHQEKFSLLTPTGQTLGAHGEEKSRCSSTALTVKMESSIQRFDWKTKMWINMHLKNDRFYKNIHLLSNYFKINL